MQNKSWLIVFGVFLLGAILFSFALVRSFKTDTESQLQLRLASVTREGGTVTLIKAGLSGRALVEKELWLSNLETITTNNEGLALVQFVNGPKVRVLENTIVSVELKEEGKLVKTVIRLHQGDLRVEVAGDLIIEKNGVSLSAQDFLTSDLIKSPTEISELARFLNEPQQEQSTLSENEISITVNSYKSLFFKCYGPLVERNKGQLVGSISARFQISNTGRTSNIDFSGEKQLLSDTTFTRCVTDVFERINFRNFGGEKILAEVPLQFE